MTLTLPWIWSFAIHHSTNTCLPGTRVPIHTSSECLWCLPEIHWWLWFIGCALEFTLKYISFSEWVSRQTSTNKNRITVASATNRIAWTRSYAPDIAAQWVTFFFCSVGDRAQRLAHALLNALLLSHSQGPQLYHFLLIPHSDQAWWAWAVAPVACEAEAGGPLEFVKSRLS